MKMKLIIFGWTLELVITVSSDGRQKVPLFDTVPNAWTLKIG